MKRELKISAIKNGTVIDHITPGKAFEVARILGLEDFSAPISIAVNVSSGKSGTKDIIKVENRELSKDEVNRISLVAPNATVNIVKGYEVAKKKKVEIPSEIVDILPCSNANCITHFEPVKTKFQLEGTSPMRIRCYYCERVLTEEDIKREIAKED
ncbi:MAG: aspartate carbamoyltransferase regulatory subunit [Theionarchaea archaeon]|nr:aspartate carbamoyltransferase regulatory subunit [Theionarchaea archaeon]MBU7037203.1 aspartate carbamoyltransferase regulatory subunit [Theionarchaea archaeon]